MEYKERLSKSFPRALENDVVSVLDTLPFNINTPKWGNDQLCIVNLISSSEFSIKLNNDFLSIPYRIYFNEPDPGIVSQLTCTQKVVLNCIYTRHHDGYVRQRRLEELAGINEYWVIPYTLQLLGEYVVEILQVLDKVITDDNIEYYKSFIIENPKYWQQTISRMTSYWHCYYREKWFSDNREKVFPELNDYPGQQIVSRIGNKT